MQISLNWLNDYVDIKKIPAQDIARALTDIGLEVESITTQSSLKGDVIVGKILAAEKHPDADTLRVCKVDVGRGEPLDIVCGAPNARAGIKACVALVGSELPGDFKIKKSKIRGVVSNGMMCAEDELGLSKNHDTIIELSDDIAIGTSVAELYGMQDTVLTLGITPNRGDCFGHLGIARDLSAKLKIPLRYPQQARPEILSSIPTSEKIQIEIENAEDCARFSALYIDRVRVAPSPLWLKQRVEAAGMRSINNIVDITNYAMLEYGLPVHAYDQRDIRGNKIIVRKAKRGENLTTLDGDVRSLVNEDLMICDEEGPIGLAGIMGGANSEIKEDTSTIILEVANFSPKLIRKTAKRLGIHTEASHRFERGADMTVTDKVAWRIAALIERTATELGLEAPAIANSLVDVYPQKKVLGRIAVRTERARHILGFYTLEPKQIIDHLEALGFAVLDQTADQERILVQVPSWRMDMESEIDLIEEIGRMVGYEHLPYRLPSMEIGGVVEAPHIGFIDHSKRVMANIGFTEVISLPFIGAKDLTDFAISDMHPYAKAIKLANPLAEQENHLRPLILMNLLKALQGNRRRNNKGTRLFEVGRTYLNPLVQQLTLNGDFLSSIQEQGVHVNERARQDVRCIEQNKLAFVIDQPYRAKSWYGAEINANFFHAKEALTRFLGALGRAMVALRAPIQEELPFLHPAASAIVELDGKACGFIGELHPQVAQSLEFDPAMSPVVGEVNLDRACLALRKPVKVDTQDRKFPPVNRDLAFVVDRSVSYEKLCSTIDRFRGRRNLRGIRLFDVYQGDKVAADKKSMAISCSFQSPKRTLNDKEVELEIDALKGWLKEELSAELR